MSQFFVNKFFQLVVWPSVLFMTFFVRVFKLTWRTLTSWLIWVSRLITPCFRYFCYFLETIQYRDIWFVIASCLVSNRGWALYEGTRGALCVIGSMRLLSACGRLEIFLIRYFQSSTDRCQLFAVMIVPAIWVLYLYTEAAVAVGVFDSSIIFRQIICVSVVGFSLHFVPSNQFLLVTDFH